MNTNLKIYKFTDDALNPDYCLILANTEAVAWKGVEMVVGDKLGIRLAKIIPLEQQMKPLVLLNNIIPF